MFLNTITLDYISAKKYNSMITLTCDACQANIQRIAKYVKYMVKNGQKQAFCSNKCQASLTRKIYNKTCPCCEIEYSTSEKDGKFCSKSCSNKFRKHTQETKDKISNKLKGRTSILNNSKSKKPTKLLYKNILKKQKTEPAKLEICSLFTCKCKKCNFIGSYRKQRKYCSNCESCYSENGRSKYVFTFNVYNYPDLFDLTLLYTIGWRVTKGKNKNVYGISRDHKVSVHEAIINDYDPYYIKHPLNCQLMTHIENQNKGTSSSLTYQELIKLVDDYDKC